MPPALAQFVHLTNQVAVVLITQRRHESIGITVAISAMTTGAVLTKDCPAKGQVIPLAVLRLMDSGALFRKAAMSPNSAVLSTQSAI
jgi:hypothetical protein